jgi:plastocyanin
MLGTSRQKLRAVVGGLGVLALLGGGTTYFGSADASTPAEGTISASGDHAVAWTGGPFVTPNVTGTGLDAPDCSAPESCDDFLLHVKAPSGYGDQHQLKVSVSWSNTAADFDIYLLNSKGESVATAASSADPELMITAPKAGDYTVRVVPFAPAGESYKATASLVKIPKNPAPGDDTAPAFKNYKAPKALTDSNNAGEPSIGNNFKTGATMYQSYLSTYRVKFAGGKASWADASASVATGCPQGSTESLDPILFTDRQTGRTFESQLTGVDSASCYTDDDGRTWLPSTGGGIPSGVDHQSIGGGPYTPDGAGSLPTTDYPHAVYYCSQDIATAFCAASQDGGTTFGAGVPTYNLTQCGGLHGHVKVAPDGTAYLPNKSCGDNAAVAVSEDDGLTWTVHPVGPSTVGDSDPSVGISANGTVYFGYVGADGKPGVATSTDRGKTWKYGQKVGQDFGVKNAVFPTLVAGSDQRATYAYLGTTSGGDYQNAATFKGVWHLYLSTTYDGGKTWVTSDATPHDPVQRGSLCTAGTTCGNDRNLLDFMDVTLDSHGRILVGYADGCIDACVNDATKNGHDAYATIARQSGGKTLFAKYDHKKKASGRNVTMQSVKVTRSGAQLVATVTIRNTGGKVLHQVGSRVRDNGRTVAKTARFTLRPGQTRTARVRWTPVGTRRHHVVAEADSGNRIRETNEGDNNGHDNVVLP